MRAACLARNHGPRLALGSALFLNWYRQLRCEFTAGALWGGRTGAVHSSRRSDGGNGAGGRGGSCQAGGSCHSCQATGGRLSRSDSSCSRQYNNLGAIRGLELATTWRQCTACAALTLIRAVLGAGACGRAGVQSHQQCSGASRAGAHELRARDKARQVILN